LQGVGKLPAVYGDGKTHPYQKLLGVKEVKVLSIYFAVINGVWPVNSEVPAPNVAALGYVCGARPRWFPSKSGSVSTKFRHGR
jgi:hypothetical protein